MDDKFLIMPAPLWPPENHMAEWTDSHLSRARQVVGRFGDCTVTIAVFMRRPVLAATRVAVDWLNSILTARQSDADIIERFAEGQWVGAGEPLMYITGSFLHLADIETLFLMKLGSACVAAYNADAMCQSMPGCAFMAMDGRHCAGTEMADLMAYAAAVGSGRARRKAGAIGFVGNTTDATAHYFGNERGAGGVCHALVGYAGSTVRAAEMYHETWPEQPLTVPVDYFGHEVTDALALCRKFPALAAEGRLTLRLDTPATRFMEALDPQKCYDILDHYAPQSVRGYYSLEELAYLTGPGVSAAAVWTLREKLNDAGFDKVKIAASSGFCPAKCKVIAEAQAPIDLVITGAFLPERWPETHAAADIIAYGGEGRVRSGREFLQRR